MAAAISPVTVEARRAAGRAVRRERLARARRLRVVVATFTVTAFIVLFAVIYIQMALGDDPAIGAGAAAKQTVASSGTNAHSASAAAAARRRAVITTSTTTSSPAPVTTSQS